MKGKVILSSMLLGLIFPLNTFANASTQTSISIPNQENFNTLENVEIARRIPEPNQQSAEYVAFALRSYQRVIYNMAYELSGSKVRWENIEVSTYKNYKNNITIFLYGQIPVRVLKDPKIDIWLNLERNSNGLFNFVSYGFDVYGKGPVGKARQEAERKLRNLPNYYPDFNQLLDWMLRCRMQRDTGHSYHVSGC